MRAPYSAHPEFARQVGVLTPIAEVLLSLFASDGAADSHVVSFEAAGVRGEWLWDDDKFVYVFIPAGVPRIHGAGFNTDASGNFLSYTNYRHPNSKGIAMEGAGENTIPFAMADDFTDAGWRQQANSVDISDSLNPGGVDFAHDITFSNTTTKSQRKFWVPLTSTEINKPQVNSLYVKSVAGEIAVGSLAIVNNASDTVVAETFFTTTDEWQRVAVVGIPATTGHRYYIYGDQGAKFSVAYAMSENNKTFASSFTKDVRVADNTFEILLSNFSFSDSEGSLRFIAVFDNDVDIITTARSLLTVNDSEGLSMIYAGSDGSVGSSDTATNIYRQGGGLLADILHVFRLTWKTAGDFTLYVNDTEAARGIFSGTWNPATLMRFMSAYMGLVHMSDFELKDKENAAYENEYPTIGGEEFTIDGDLITSWA